MEYAERLQAISSRIDAACARSGRASDSVTLIAVSKTFPIEDVAAAHAAGQVHFGENKIQELVSKSEHLPGKAQGGAVAWHMIGHPQRNKIKYIAPFIDLIHGVDSLRLAEEIDKRAAQHGRIQDVLLQVNVSGEESKSGLDPAELPALLDAVAPLAHVQVCGLMTLASPTDEESILRREFALMRTLRDAACAQHPSVVHLSMGMSGDFEWAIEEGATMVRVGSAIFGRRAYP